MSDDGREAVSDVKEPRELLAKKAAKTANVQEWPPSALPRCPFCNSSDIVTPIMRGTATVCQACRARGPHKDRPTEAAAAWTSRAPDPVRARLVAALEWIAEDGCSDSRAVECARAALEP